jgi:hypothetical protein
MRIKLGICAALAALTAAFVGTSLAPAASAATTATNLNAVPVQGTIASTGGTFDGTADVNRVGIQNGKLMAQGTLTGTVLNSAGNAVGSIADQPVSLPLTSDGGSCQIADLQIGTINLDVLGLVVHLDPVHLNISGQTGSGNLLGNLLCSVTHLLDGNSLLSGLLGPIVNLLNTVLARL